MLTARLGAKMDSLLLSCTTLSFATTCRFIPAHPVKRRSLSIRETLDDVKLHAREAVFIDINPERLESLQRAGFRTSVHNLRSLAVTRAE